MKRRWTKRDEEGGEGGRCVSILLLLMLLFVLRALGGKGCEKWGWMWKMWSMIIIHVLLCGGGTDRDRKPMREKQAGVGDRCRSSIYI